MNKAINDLIKNARNENERKILKGFLAKFEKRKVYEDSFYEFVKRAFKVLEPSTIFSDSPFIKEICNQLEKEIKRFPAQKKKGLSKKKKKAMKPEDKDRDIVINIPPRSLKSFICSICFPAWGWTKRPYLKFVCSSYSKELSADLARDCRTLIESTWYQSNWGDVDFLNRTRPIVKLLISQKSKVNFGNTEGGKRFSTSVGGTATGFGGDFVICDDLQNQKQSNSESARKDAWEHYTKTLSSRLNQPKTGSFIIVQQRLHEEDITGKLKGESLPQETPEEITAKNKHLIKFHRKYRYICLPADLTQPENEELLFPKDLKKLYTNKYLSPKRLGIEELSNLQSMLGSYEYAGQYNQSPAPFTGGIVKVNWLKKYVDIPNTKNLLRYFSIDLPFDDDKKSKNPDSVDYAAIGVYAVNGRYNYKIDSINQKWDIIRQQSEILKLWKKYRPHGILIENAANGPALIKLLQDKGIPGVITIARPSVSKTVRLTSVLPKIEAGELWFPANAPWVPGNVKQLTKFPNVKHDDIVDETVQFLIWRGKQGSW